MLLVQVVVIFHSAPKHITNVHANFLCTCKLNKLSLIEQISVSSRGTRLKEAKSRLESQKRHLVTLWYKDNRSYQQDYG